MAIVLTGCSNPFDSSSKEDPVEIMYTDVHINDSASVKLGLPFDILYTLNAEGEFNSEKRVSFYLLQNEPDTPTSGIEEEVDRVEYSFYLGDAQITHLVEGDNSFSLSVVLPEEVPSSGYYYITGKISDNSDDFTDYDDVFSSEEIEVDISTREITNLVLTDFELDSTNVFIDDDFDIDTLDALSQPYHGNTDLFGNLTVNSFNNAAENIRIRVMVLVDDIWENIEIWDSDLSSFADHLIVTLEENKENQSIGLDMNFSDDLLAKIDAYADVIEDNQFKIRVYADPDDDVAEVSENDNYLDAHVQFFLSSANRMSNALVGYSVEKSFSPIIGPQEYVAVKSEFEFKAGVDVMPPRATASARFKLTPQLLKKEKGLAQIDLNAQYGIIPQDRGVLLAVKWQGKKVYDKQLAGKSLAATWKKDWYKEQDFFYGRVIVAGVPVNFSTGAKGGVGFRFDLGVTDKLYVYGNIPSKMDLGLYGRGGVDLVAVEVGVEINGNLAVVDCVAAAEVNLNLMAGTNTEWKLLNADINTEAFYDIALLSARLGLYAIIPEIKWCKKWRVSYPCGVKSSRPKYLWLLESPAGYRKKATLLHKDFTWQAPRT